MPEQAQIQALSSEASPEATRCWSCRGPATPLALFCPTCNAVQPPGMLDHFARLGLGAEFDLDQAELERHYFQVQRLLHPDRFATTTPREKALSQLQATAINEAYETLKDPLKRADYLVHLRGSGVLAEGCNLVNDRELLLETLELREALADAETVDDVRKLERRAAADVRNCVAALSDAFSGDDLEQACRLTTRLKYLRKLAEECRARRRRLSGEGR